MRLDLTNAEFTRTMAIGEELVVYDADTIYVRRVVKSKADKRLWARLELDRLPDQPLPSFDDLLQGAQPGDAVVLSPGLLTDLLSGALTGSVRQERVADDGSRLISFNASIDKASRELDLDDDDRDAREKLLRALAIKDDIGPAETVLREDGSVSRVTIVFAERPDKQTRLDLEADLVLGPQPADADGPAPAPPPRNRTVRVRAIGALRSTLSEHLQQFSVQAQLTGGAPPPAPEAAG